MREGAQRFSSRAVKPALTFPIVGNFSITRDLRNFLIHGSVKQGELSNYRYPLCATLSNLGYYFVINIE
jgi:hypothetical protein